MRRAAISLTLLSCVLAQGCGDDEYVPADVPTHVLSPAVWDEIDGALERIDAWCNALLSREDGQRIANEGFDTLERIAERHPHGIYHSRGSNLTMADLLRSLDDCDDCGYAQQLAEIGTRLRDR